jgi:hypothetical protein
MSPAAHEGTASGGARATLEKQRQLQVRFHSTQGAWIVWIAVVGFGFSAVGLAAAWILARHGQGLSAPKLALLWFGFLCFGAAPVFRLTWPLRLRPRIVPCFSRQIEEYGGRTSAAFPRGRGLYREIVTLEALADTLGVTPLSTFGFTDDYYGQEVRWHPASEGVKTAGALRESLDARLLADRDVTRDLEALGSVLAIAAGQGVDFALTLRLQKDSLQVVSSWEQRQGRFW